MQLLPCPCGKRCSLSYQTRGSQQRVVAYPCGTEGPVRGWDTVVTTEEAAKAWNEWIVGIEATASATFG